MILRGFASARCFVSISKNTRAELHRFLKDEPIISEVVYNGLNFPFYPMNHDRCLSVLSRSGLKLPSDGFILHVGGNQWYKNRHGVLEAYRAYASRVRNPLPLWMVGAPPTRHMIDYVEEIGSLGEIKFISGLPNETVCAAYSSAKLLLFPSYAEGFGWPIAEAMACGCPVLTTNLAPMTEVGGDAAFYTARKPDGESGDWADNVALQAIEILNLSAANREHTRQLGIAQSAKFSAERALDGYEHLYMQAKM